MLTAITLNLNYYVDKHGTWDVRKKLICRALDAEKPDIVALQAVAKHPHRYDGKDQALQLCEELHGFRFHFFKEAQRTPEGLIQGSAIISRVPMVEASHIALDLKKGLDDTNHRILVRTTFDTQQGKLDFYSAHFSWVEEQSTQNVAQAIHSMKDGNRDVMFAGDLNTPPESPAFELFRQAGFVDAWQRLKGENDGFTFESDKPSVRIDYFWVSQSLSTGLQTISIIFPPADSAARLSDHLGLMVKLDKKLVSQPEGDSGIKVY